MLPFQLEQHLLSMELSEMSGMTVHHKERYTVLKTMMWKDWGLLQKGKNPRNTSLQPLLQINFDCIHSLETR